MLYKSVVCYSDINWYLHLCYHLILEDSWTFFFRRRWNINRPHAAHSVDGPGRRGGHWRVVGGCLFGFDPCASLNLLACRSGFSSFTFPFLFTFFVAFFGSCEDAGVEAQNCRNSRVSQTPRDWGQAPETRLNWPCILFHKSFLGGGAQWFGLFTKPPARCT